jgi:RimJ/RimL family protein N-acetyltransferase
MELRALRATPRDVLLFFKWARDPTIRGNSVLQDPATLGVYRKWFNKVLFSKKNCLLIIEGRNKNLVWVPVGQVRFNQRGEIGLSLSDTFRGRHLATQAIKIGIHYLHRHSPLRLIFAHIKQDNKISTRAFEVAGFQFVCETIIGGHAFQRYVYLQSISNGTRPDIRHTLE